MGFQDDDFESSSEYFMKICEAKGDYSFVYSIAPRSKIDGRRWCPVEGKFPLVLPEPLIFGKGQPGNIQATHIQLDNMYRLVPRTIGFDGLRTIKTYLEKRTKANHYSSSNEVAKATLELLRSREFSGCGAYIELENGFFFTQSNTVISEGMFVAISIDVHWQGGAPGILLCSNETGINDFCDVGAFIGRIPKDGESINVG